MVGGSGRLLGWVSYAFAFAVGIFLCVTVFPAEFVLPPAAMERTLEGDFAQHVVGQRYFLADAWRWPLLRVENLNAPDGVSIGFTDSIPLVSIVMKAFAFALPPGFHGFGLWYVLAWLAQPVAAVWCLRMAGERRLLPAVAIALIAGSMPAWWNRFPHASLTGHFLIWLGIGMYFVLVRDGRAWRWLTGFLVLIATLLAHPYLWAMNCVILLAVPLTHAFNRDRRWRTSLAYAMAAVLASCAAAWALGYLGARGGWGFGEFSMNLLSPVWPAGSSLLPWGLPMVHATEFGGWEGYNYLGAGILLGFAALLLVSRGGLFAGLSRHGGLVLVAVSLFVFALSNKIGVGGYMLGEMYPENMLWGTFKPVFQAFRSSGRMFWPVGYLIALGLVIAAARVEPRWLAAVLLIGMAGLQFADNRHARAELAQRLRNGGEPWAVDAPALRAQFAQAQRLNIYPRWECVNADNVESTHKLLLQLLTLASETALPVNTMYVARWHHMRNCDDAREAALALEPGELRIFTPIGAERYGASVPDAASLCTPLRAPEHASLGDLLICARPAQ